MTHRSGKQEPMSERLRRITPEQARIGMYVHAFEGSWLSHPFWRRSFLIADAADLQRIREHDIPALVIDESRGAPLERPTLPGRVAAVEQERRATSGSHRAPADPEVARARAILQSSKRVLTELFGEVRLGRVVTCADVAGIVDEVSASVARNPHALIGISRLRTKDEYTYVHSVAVCALMVNLARVIDLAEPEVRQAGFAGLLHDIGKMAVPEPILNKPGRLNDEELVTVREHPERGYQILCPGEDVPDMVLDVARHHHERMDGSGYPFGLSGDQLSRHARMAAICDVYDALTSTRAYKDGWTPCEAATAMYAWDGHFDRTLLFKFFRSMGVFPVGMLVRLRSNRLGVMLDNGRRASRPKVKAFFSIMDRAPITPEIVTLTDSLAGDGVVSEEDPLRWGFEDWEAMRDRLVKTSVRVIPTVRAAA
jgi:putative nucleotidyltransferase with HDIG domain